MSEFKEKNDLIQELLKKSGLEFRKSMSRDKREKFDVERQNLVLRAGWNNMSVTDLRNLVTSRTLKDLREVSVVISAMISKKRRNLFWRDLTNLYINTINELLVETLPDKTKLPKNAARYLHELEEMIESTIPEALKDEIEDDQRGD